MMILMMLFNARSFRRTRAKIFRHARVPLRLAPAVAFHAAAFRRSRNILLSCHIFGAKGCRIFSRYISHCRAYNTLLIARPRRAPKDGVAPGIVVRGFHMQHEYFASSSSRASRRHITPAGAPTRRIRYTIHWYSLPTIEAEQMRSFYGH